MMVIPWCESYYKLLSEQGFLWTGECGCQHPTEMPWLSFSTDAGLSEKVTDENVTESDMAAVFAAAGKNVYGGGPITKESVNDLFMSLEQPPYDNIVRLFLVPQEFKDDLRSAIQGAYDDTPSGMRLWAAEVKFTNTGGDLLAVIGSSGLIHGFRIAKSEMNIDLTPRLSLPQIPIPSDS